MNLDAFIYVQLTLRALLLACLLTGLLLGLLACVTGAGSAKPGQRVLRVCSDPNNLPFSNENEEGFENKIADLIAADMKATVEYTWHAQRRGFIRNTLREGKCDVVIGVPANFEMAATTRPYYRSTYVFVSRADRNLRIESFDDPILRKLLIGIHVIGDDYANPPPAHALANRKIIRNVSGYSLFGDYSEPNPPARLIEAVAEGEVDLAIAWGPFAGFFAKRQNSPLRITPVSPEIDPQSLPFVFDIAMGVRRDEDKLRSELETILHRREGEIARILSSYGIPVKQMNR